MLSTLQDLSQVTVLPKEKLNLTELKQQINEIFKEIYDEEPRLTIKYFKSTLRLHHVAHFEIHLSLSLMNI